MAVTLAYGESPPRRRLFIVPIASVMAASMIPALLPMIASSPILPPFGLLLLLGWRLLRHELWPVWIGVPLGLWDDLFSGQPIGSAMALWSLVILGIDMADRRIFWRDVWQDWGLAALAILLCQLVGAWLAVRPYPMLDIALVMAPQIILTILLFPISLRLVGWLDNKRLRR